MWDGLNPEYAISAIFALPNVAYVAVFASSNGEGTTVYRLMTQTGQYICLQTKGYLEFNKSTNKIETFICINKLIR